MFNKIKTACIDYLQSNGIRFMNLNDRSLVISYSGNRLECISIMVHFDADETNGNVLFDCYEIARIPESKMIQTLTVCNQLNGSYKCVKFNIDAEGKLHCRYDAPVVSDKIGEECHLFLRLIVNIVDTTYPIFEKLLKN